MTVNIWRFTDGKSGHDSQSTGLCDALSKRASCDRFDIQIDPFFISFNHLLLRQFPAGDGLPDPDLIIGAGHGTHLPMLAARRARGGKLVVLMRPSLPLAFFDICIIPKHDLPPDKDNVIKTTGAINPIQFNNDKISNEGLILLGGISKHYQWNDELIIRQINDIVFKNPDVQWTIATSSRTPEKMLSTINKHNHKNVSVLVYEKTTIEKIHELIFKSKIIWVSADSVSMIYESLTSGASVGLIELDQNKKTRLNAGISELINMRLLTTFRGWEKTGNLAPDTIKLNEAERCALLLKQHILD